MTRRSSSLDPGVRHALAEANRAFLKKGHRGQADPASVVLVLLSVLMIILFAARS